MKIFKFALSIIAATVITTNISVAQTRSDSSATNSPSMQQAIKEAKQASFKAYIRTRAFDLRGKDQTNFPGRWAGTFIIAKTTCNNLNNRFAFRHVIAMSGASTRIDTSHDGAFFGRSRQGGIRLETLRAYTRRDGLSVDSALVYQNLRGRQARTGFAAVLSDGFNSCSFAYGAGANRA
jgi:hypothetical protein